MRFAGVASSHHVTLLTDVDSSRPDTSGRDAQFREIRARYETTYVLKMKDRGHSIEMGPSLYSCTVINLPTRMFMVHRTSHIAICINTDYDCA